MSEGLKALFAALADLGTQDIYTDVDQYRGRTSSMYSLCKLAGEALEGKRITEKRVKEALAAAEQDKELYHEGELE